MANPQASLAQISQPTWEIAQLFPSQGDWTEAEYLALETNHLIEFSDGYLEILPMPGFAHQRIVLFLYRILWAFVTEHELGEVLVAPLPVQLWEHKFREPDLIYIRAEKRNRQPKGYAVDPDLVIEVVSAYDPERDYETKRQEYARAGIAEYWIVDPVRRAITALALAGEQYELVGEFTPGQQVTSKLLAGFAVDVTELFAAAT
jgi:Uma2 family endonuclease